MSDTSRAHKEKAPKTLGFAVFTCSTTRYYDHEAGKQVTDESGDLTVRILETNGHVVLSRALVPDNKALIEANVKEAIKSNKIDALITIGGTGIAPSDVTIETVEPLLEKNLPGFSEIFRSISYDEIGSVALASRAIAGVTNGKAIFCIPGSPNAVETSLEKLILPEVGHIILHARGR